jgi:hypothetical protein
MEIPAIPTWARSGHVGILSLTLNHGVSYSCFPATKNAINSFLDSVDIMWLKLHITTKVGKMVGEWATTPIQVP